MRNMFLTSRFFLLLAASSLLSVAGFYQPACFVVARIGVGVLSVLVVLDFFLLRLATHLHAVRHVKPRLSNTEDNGVSIRVENIGQRRVWLTVRDELPGVFRYHDAVFRLSLRSGQGKTIRYTLRPTERGAYSFGYILAFARTALGMLERKIPLGQTETVKVYPAFDRLSRYELAAMANDLRLSGQKRIRRAGNSTEYDQIKEYVPGDDYRRLNWKASAHMGRWMINTYCDERSQPVWCLIDKGRVMQRTFAHVSLLDYAINATLALSYVALQRYDMAGMVSFDAQVNRMVAASRRPDQLQQLLEALYAQQVRYAESDYSALAVHLSRYVRRRSLLVLFTDFTTRDALRRQLPYLRRMARSHCLLVVFFDDEEVRELAQKPASSLQDLRLKTLAADFSLLKRAMVSELRQNGLYALLTTPRCLTVDTLNKYLELKRQQAI